MKFKTMPDWLRVLLVLSLIAALLVIGKVLDVPERLRELLVWVQRLGWMGVGLFIILYVLACLFLIPGSILTLGAGVVFGLVKGSVIVSVASTLGATAAFLTGRYFARDWVLRKIENNTKFKAIDSAIGREGWRIVGLTRLSPVFPFSMLNYAFGVTKVSLVHYFLASWIGMLPGTIMYVYIGSLAGSLANLDGIQGQSNSSVRLVFYGVGLLATAAVTFYVTRIARKALDQKIEGGDKS